MIRTFHLAVLECDTPLPATHKARGDYADIFRALLVQGLKDMGSDVQLEVTKWDVVAQEFPDPDKFDGFLLTGARSAAFENEPWILQLVDFVKNVHAVSTKPIVGLCFGHQIIGRALGAKVGVNPGGREISVTKIDLNEEGQRVLGIPSIELHQMHRDAVLEVPRGTVNLGSTACCAIQGLYSPGRIFSLQAHPEFDEPIMAELLEARHEIGILDDQMYEEGVRNIGRPHSGAFMCTKIWNFLLDSNPVTAY